jgi:ligand-binding sensor domain-containing protein
LLGVWLVMGMCGAVWAQAEGLFAVHASTRPVLCLCELHGEDGALLVGTEGGLVVVAGGRERRLLAGVPVRGLCALSDEQALVAADTGLYRYDGKALVRLSEEPTTAVAVAGGRWYTGHPEGVARLWQAAGALPQEVVRTGSAAPVSGLVPDGETLFVATLEGLWRVGPEGAQRQRLSLDPLSGNVSALERLGGRVVAGTPAGLFGWAAGEWARLVSGPGAQPFVTALADRGDGSALVADDTEGVYLLREGALTPLAGAPRETSALWVRDDGTVVAGTATDGAWLLRLTADGAAVEGQERLTRHDGELPQNAVTSLAWARDSGVLYAGTATRGVGALRGSVWTATDRARGLPSDWVNQVASDGSRLYLRDSAGRVFTGDGHGGWRVVGKKQDGWPKDWTSGLGYDAGTLWVGTYGAFYLKGPRGWEVHAPKPQLQGKMVTDLAFRGDEVWLATPKHGLLCWNRKTGQWRSYGLAEGFPDTWVTGVEVLGKEVWAGTFGQGVARLVESGGKQTWEVFRPGGGAATLPSERVNCMKVAAGRLYVGTLAGVTATDGRTWRTWGLREGMVSDSVRALETDGENLWIATDGGLCQAFLKALGLP